MKQSSLGACKILLIKSFRKGYSEISGLIPDWNRQCQGLTSIGRVSYAGR
jgi:hypothetical protein